jgi:glycosyltransferase involved in cell wall biosynthesis
VRIGLVIYGSLDIISGGYLYDRILVEYLRKVGDEVQIVSLPWRSYFRHLGDNFSSSLRSLLEHAKWDLLLQDELNHPSLFRLNVKLKKSIPYPIISIIHHLRCCEQRAGWKNLFYRYVERSYLNSVDGFVFNSSTTRFEVERLIGVSKPHVVAYPGRDRFDMSFTNDQIEERALQSGPLRILFLGNVIPRKGLHTLIDAVAILPREIWELEVVGNPNTDKSYADSIHHQIVRRGISNQVKFRGLLSDVEIADSLSKAHLLAVPSSYEGFGMVYLEAMSFGLPIIATSSGAAGELITHGQEGYLIATEDARALAGHIKTYHENRELLLQMSLRAYERQTDFPTWEQTDASIRDFLLGIAHSS